MTVLVVVILVVPGILFASYRLQRARELKKRRSRGAADLDRGAGSAVARLGKQQRRWELRRLGYRYADDRVFVHGTGVFTGVVIDTSTDEFATAGETGDTAMLPVGIYQALLGLFDGDRSAATSWCGTGRSPPKGGWISCWPTPGIPPGCTRSWPGGSPPTSCTPRRNGCGR